MPADTGIDGGLFTTTPAVLVLADGTVFRGEAPDGTAPTDLDGADGAFGEVVFNTALSGYQEVVSDPSYAGQVVVMTYPHIGNYGANPDDDEATAPAASALVVRELSPVASNHRASETFDAYLHRNGVTVVSGVDTRRLTRHIRDAGAMTGGVFVGDAASTDVSELVDRVRARPSMEGLDLASVVTCDAPYASPFRPDEVRFRVALVDFGVKRTILRRLAARGCDVTVHPASTPADTLLADGPDGVMLSNGPGDPAAVTGADERVRALLGRVPVFGICLGHQILSLALGATTRKLPFGHHGANHPVAELATGVVEITSQNHGFNVTLGDDTDTDPRRPPARVAGDFGDVVETHRNLNDGTLEGVRCEQLPVFSVQYHPEAGPGPHDAAYLFDRFAEAMTATATKGGN
jgi:carbamoyl-phosphate synthase small subunit